MNEGRREGLPYRVSIEVVNRECKILKLLRDSGIDQFAVIDIRRLFRGAIRHLVKIPAAYPSKTSKHPGVKIRNSLRLGGESAIWFETEGCNACNTITSKGAFLVTAWNSGEDKIIYVFVAPSASAAQDIVSTLESLGFKLKILGMERYRGRTSILTERQEAALWLALEAGFFDHPKRINIVELSRKLNVSPSTLSEILKRGIRRLLEHYFEEI